MNQTNLSSLNYFFFLLKIFSFHIKGMPTQNLSGTLSPWVGNLTNLQSVRLNNNSLTGPCPQSLSNIEGLTLVDLSYNNLRGSLPRIPAKTLKIVGNPLICGPKSNNCSTLPKPVSFPLDALKVVSFMAALGFLLYGGSNMVTLGDNNMFTCSI
ncbi:uncharacterized protein [Arachis hypogaea]|uniref:uncharacterized protein isoform X1 n=1 Tax=Arachis hypogaea TaxID=3818 RepID=UPI003B21C64E